MALLLFVLLKIFPKRLYPQLNFYTWFVALSGLVLIITFLLAGKNIVPMKGLWQRLYLLDYYSLIMVIAIDMLATHFRKNVIN